MKKFVQIAEDWSLPLICGIIVALLWANFDNLSYHTFVHHRFFSSINFHFLVNDVFLVLFFGSVAIEITHEFSAGGALFPLKKAVVNIMAACGGVFMPIVIFYALNTVFGKAEYSAGWAIGTATDIAVALLFAKLIFPKKHPALTFLLFLAIIDDFIGLGIIAVFYPDADKPFQPVFLLLIMLAMIISLFLRKNKKQSYFMYLLPTLISWYGMHAANLHASLAMVWIVPFIPKTALHKLELHLKPIVAFGLFFFGLANAGVTFGNASVLTFIILSSLIIGKPLGISMFIKIGTLFGLKPDKRINTHDIILIGLTAGIGLTVSLFIADIAYINSSLQDGAKMGALLSVISGVGALLLAKTLFKHKI
jgi:Na+:H+ antiporter, NhaA family